MKRERRLPTSSPLASLLSDRSKNAPLRSVEFSDQLLAAFQGNPPNTRKDTNRNAILKCLFERDRFARFLIAIQGAEAMGNNSVREYLGLLADLIKDTTIEEAARKTYKKIHQSIIRELTPDVKKMETFTPAEMAKMDREYKKEFKKIKAIFSKNKRSAVSRAMRLREAYPGLSEKASDDMVVMSPREAALFLLSGRGIKRYKVEPSYLKDLIDKGKPKTLEQIRSAIVSKVARQHSFK